MGTFSRLQVTTQWQLPLQWQEHEANPLIEYNQDVAGVLLADPCVLKVDGGYVMYMGGGKPFDTPGTVDVYRAVSLDGVDWCVSQTPVLTHGAEGEWDSDSAETPTVVKVGDTYHMYYTGTNQDIQSGQYSIGHAISEDGITWTKDPLNPVLSPHDDPLRWGFFTTAEPSIVHHNGMFYLYYASAKSNYPEPGSPFGIMRTTSQDGTHFTPHEEAVHTLSPIYDPLKYRGYTTPSVFVDQGIFHMYYGLVKDPDGFEQVAINHAISYDGLTFREIETDIVTLEDDWKSVAIIGPSALPDGSEIKLYFGAQHDSPERDWSDFRFGIGLTTQRTKTSKRRKTHE